MMMTIKCFECNMLQENCYIVSDDTKEAVVIDCGALWQDERQAIVNYIRQNGLSLKHVLCTHGHLDHCFGIDLLWHEFGVKPEVSRDDDFLASHLQEQASQMFGMQDEIEQTPVGQYLTPNAFIRFGNHQLQVLPTPGHTPGGVIFYCAEEHVAFSGDTLFRMSIGRTDFPRGSYEQMIDSLHNVVARLPKETKVYPGHGPQTTIQDELTFNPYFR